MTLQEAMRLAFGESNPVKGGWDLHSIALGWVLAHPLDYDIGAECFEVASELAGWLRRARTGEGGE